MYQESCLESYGRVLKKLYGFFGGSDPNVPRVERSLAFVSVADMKELRNYPFVFQVTGTNGKGATCAFLEQLLMDQGRHVITVTSPHVNSLRERIRIDGQPLSQARFVELFEKNLPVVKRLHGGRFHPQVLQIVLWMAFRLHYELGPDWFGIYEVGRGGQSDSTNVFLRGAVALTTVAEDHLQDFGGTLTSLAAEKVGLCQSAQLLVTQRQHPSVSKVIYAYCHRNDVRVYQSAKNAENTSASCFGMRGPWQWDNLALASELVGRQLGTTTDLTPQVPVSLPARLEERFVQGRLVVLDGGHNLPAFQSSLGFIERKYGHRRCVAIIGFGDDKDWRSMVRLLCQSEVFPAIVCTRSSSGHPVEAYEIEQFASAWGRCAQSFPSLRSALAWFITSEFDMAAILGSFLLCRDFDRSLHLLGLTQYAAPIESIDPTQHWMQPLD